MGSGMLSLVLVTVIVVIATVAELLVFFGTIEDETGNIHMKIIELARRFSKLLLHGVATARDQHKATTLLGKDRGIIGHNQRSGINNYIVILLQGMINKLSHNLRIQQLCCIRRLRTSRHYMQIRLPKTLYHILDRRLARKYMGKTYGTINIKLVSNRRMTKICINK